MILPLISFCILPFILPMFIGVFWPIKLGLRILLVFLVLGFGFTSGLIFAWFFAADPEYFRAYEFPVFWTTTFVDALPLSAPMYKMLFVPFIFLADLVRVYLHFNLTNFSIPLIIPEIISFFTLRNFWVVLSAGFNLKS